jgi:hypothetical protein
VQASLGGRLCALRGLVFFELKHGALRRALAATTSDADHAAVSISRHRATTARERDEPAEAARHSVTAQLTRTLTPNPTTNP